jgi:hypothetical protein
MYMPTNCCTKNCTFRSVYGFSEILRINGNILLHSIKQSVLELERECVVFEVGNKFLIPFRQVLRDKKLETNKFLTVFQANVFRLI